MSENGNKGAGGKDGASATGAGQRKPHRGKKRGLLVGILAIVVVAIMALVAVGGMGNGQHQVISAGKACAECHSDRTEVSTAPSDVQATQVSSTFVVDTSASAVLVCRPRFTGDSGMPYVPERVSQVSASSGKAQVTLDEGTWALVVLKDGSDTEVATSALVQARSAGGESEISL